MSPELQARTTDIAPLAMRAWEPGVNSYNQLLQTIEAECENIIDPSVRLFAVDCLRGKLTHDAFTNNDHLTKFLMQFGDNEEEQGELNERQQLFLDEHKDALGGMLSPGGQALFLKQNRGLVSIEDARRTHAGSWDTYGQIDQEVRKSLDHEELESERTTCDPRYKIRQFSWSKDEPLKVGVERQRKVRSHLGGAIMTATKNFLVLNTADPTIPSELKDFLDNANSDQRNNPKNFSYARPYRLLKEQLEPHLRVPDTSLIGKDKSWAIPLLTTYYSYVTKQN